MNWVKITLEAQRPGPAILILLGNSEATVGFYTFRLGRGSVLFTLQRSQCGSTVSLIPILHAFIALID